MSDVDWLMVAVIFSGISGVIAGIGLMRLGRRVTRLEDRQR